MPPSTHKHNTTRRAHDRSWHSTRCNSGRRANRVRHARCAGGRGVSRQTHPFSRGFPAGRGQRPGSARRRDAAQPAAGPAGRGRKPLRRERQYRHRAGGTLGARWIHDASRVRRVVRDEPGAAGQGSVRPGQRLRSRHAGRAGNERAVGASVHAAQDAEAVRGARAAAAGQAQLRLAGAGQHRASVVGAFLAYREDQVDPRAVQGWRAGGGGRRGGARRVYFRPDLDADAPYQGRKIARAGGEQLQALGRAARGPCDRGGGLPRFRGERLARRGISREDAGDYRGPHAQGDGRGPQLTRNAGAARGPRARRRAEQPGGIPGPDQVRLREVGKVDPGGRAQGRGVSNKSVRIACLQLNAGNDYAANLAALDALMREAAAGDATFIFSPEYALMMDGSGRVMREKALDATGEPAVSTLAGLSRELGVWHLAGSLTLKSDDGRMFNRSILFSDL